MLRGPIRLFFLGLLCSACLLIVPQFQGNAHAAVPGAISFQGKLTNPDGTNVADGTYSILFTIYDGGTSTGGGTNVWGETQSVDVAGGLFQVQLGSVNNTLLSSVNFNDSPLYLGITVGSDAEMTPRVLFTSSPYALNSATLGGLASGSFLQIGHGLQTDASTADSLALNKTGASGNIVNLQSDSKSVFVIGNDGSAALYGNDGTTQLFSTNAGTNIVSFANGVLAVNADGSITRNPGAGKSSTTNLAAGSQSLFIAAATQTANLVEINNSGYAPTTNNANGLAINYTGGNAAVQGAGLRIDYAPGGTSGGTWNGLHIVANANGAASGVTSYGIQIEGPTATNGGTNEGVHIASGFDIGLDVASGGLQLSNMSTPAAPGANELRVFAQTLAGRTLLKIEGSSGLSTSLQPALFANKVGWWTAQGNGTTVSAINLNNTVTGTATSRSVAVTNLFTSMRRVGYVSSTTAGTSAGTRNNAAQYWMGNASGLGGFYYVARFGLSQLQTGMRSFAGLSATTGALGNADPSSFLNMIGFACDAADSQFTFMHNSGSGTATKDTLSGSFPCNTANTDMYEARIFVAPDTTTVYYSLNDLTSGALYEGSTTIKIPSSTTLMSPQIWVNNDTNAASVGVDVVSQYTETDN